MGIKIIISRKLEYLTKNREIRIYNDNKERKYIKLGEITAEIECYEDFIDDYNKFNNIKDLRLLFIVEEIDELLLRLINGAGFKNIRIISSKSNEILKANNYLEDNTYILPQLQDLEEDIDIDSIYSSLNNVIEKQMWNKGKLMVGIKKRICSIDSIPLFIIKRLYEFDKCNEFIINIYDDKVISIIDKWYIEEAIRQYIPVRATVSINIDKDYSNNNKLFFLLSAR